MRVLITGSSGYFAGELIKQLDVQDDIEIIGMTSDIEKISRNYPDITFVSNNDVFEQVVQLPSVDIVVHTAFCRKSNGKLLIESLNFLRKIVHWSIEHNVKGFINLSSQSVYGSEEGELPIESIEMNPDYLYSLAKSASEIFLEEMAENKLLYTNIRLASLMGPSGAVPNNVLYKFICTGLKGQDFSVIGGKQNFSFLDVRDAAEAVRLLMKKPIDSWNKVYNLGPEKQTNMLEMSDCICQKIFELTGNKIGYVFTSNETQLNAGMKSELIYRSLDWKPKYSFEKIVEDTIKFVVSKNGGKGNAQN